MSTETDEQYHVFLRMCQNQNYTNAQITTWLRHQGHTASEVTVAAVRQMSPVNIRIWWDTHVARVIVTAPATDPLDAYKQRVRSAVIEAARENGWCDRVDSWLESLDLEPRQSYAEYTVIIRLPEYYWGVNATNVGNADRTLTRLKEIVDPNFEIVSVDCTTVSER